MSTNIVINAPNLEPGTNPYKLSSAIQQSLSGLGFDVKIQVNVSGSAGSVSGSQIGRYRVQKQRDSMKMGIQSLSEIETGG